MASIDQPFDEREQRNVLAEILKVSSIPPFDILHLIQERQISPNWNDMVLPNGRSVSACMRAYASLTDPSTGTSAALPSASSSKKSPFSTKAKNKRPAPAEGSLTATDTSHAQSFATVNTPGGSVAYQAAAIPLHTAAGPPQKKRGRPNKAEHERRVREAAQRGEVYPRPKKTKTPRQSLEGAAGEMSLLDLMEESSTSKTTTKEPEVAPIQGQCHPQDSAKNLVLEATASAMDPVQFETEEVARPSNPETRTSEIEFPARGSLLVGMPEHAPMTVQSESDTMQGSSTLKQDSAPRSEWNTHSTTEKSTNDG